MELEADRLRNLRAVGLSLSAGLTVIAGRNGQGKSSLLEAVYVLGTGRSFRTRRFDELICWGGGPLRVAGRLQSRSGSSTQKVVAEKGVRRLLVDGSERELEDFIGRLDVVDLTGSRMDVLRGGPDERRRFLDRGVVGLRSSFLRVLGEYRRTLQQRNALLRGAQRRSADAAFSAQLDAWDERLVPAAAAVHRGRREYAVRLAARQGEIGRRLFPGGGEVTLHYRPSPRSAGEAEAHDFQRIFARKLGEGRTRDLQLGHTGHGPHRDELRVDLEGVDLRRFGSAGQVRAAMIALKLGKLSLLGEDRGESPIFLMDDFDSDLDEVRASALAAYLHEGGFQALVATSKEGMAGRLGVPFERLIMSDGSVREA